jgi:uncharacterized protein YciI
MELERYSFVLLRRGPKADEFSEAELEELQAAHLAYVASMHERGALKVAGPFSEQPDQTMRGFCLYGVELEEARRLAGSDPSVQAGRLAVDVFNWWTQKGAVAFPERSGM